MTGNVSGYGAFRNVSHLSIVNPSPRRTPQDAATPANPQRATQSTIYAAAVASARSREFTDVRSVAQRYATFEDAVFPMVLAGDRSLTVDAAVSVTKAIMNHPNLREQALRAYTTAQITSV